MDEIKKADIARDDMIKAGQKEQPKPRPKETDFDKVLERSQLASNLLPQTQGQSKTITEQAIKESAKREERQGEEKGKGEEKEEKREGSDTGQKGDRRDGKVHDHKRVVAKGQTKQGSGSSGGGGGRYGGGPGTSGGKRELTRSLLKAGSKSVPIDLQGKFAAKMAQHMKNAGAAHQATLSQQILNKVVQYVRIGLNEKGEKEIQLELHEKIFRGLKLRVIARGGKVAVHFMATDRKGREAFEKNSDAIRGALEKKGIEVDEIIVS